MSLLEISDIDLSTTSEKMFNFEWVVTLSSHDAGQNREERLVNKLIIRICRVSQELRPLLSDLESKTSYIHGSDWQRFRSYEIL